MRLSPERLESRDTPSALLPGYSQETQDFLAYRGFVGELHALSADFSGDGHPDTAVWGDAGNGPALLVFDGASRLVPSPSAGPNLPGLPPLLYDGLVPVFPTSWRNGLAVAAAGMNFVAGQPYQAAKLVATAPVDSGGGPVASVFSFSEGSFTVTNTFLLSDPDFRGGVRLASIDADGDGRQELFVTAGPGGGPRLEVFDLAGPIPRSVHSVFLADPGDRGGDFAPVDVANPPGGRPVLVFDKGGVPQPAVYYDTGEPYPDPFAGEFGLFAGRG